jgi:hypothetical protein
VNTSQQWRYQYLRRQGSSAKNALLFAKASAPSHDWEEDHGIWSTTWTADGFTITAHLEPDTDWDSTFLGEWTDRRSPDAIVNPDWYQGSRDKWHYFVPENTARSQAEYMHNHMGMSRGVAWDVARNNVLQDMALAHRSDPFVCGLVVIVTRLGVRLGHSSLWGYEFDETTFWRDPSLELDLALADTDLVHEAMAQAREALAGLCEATS